MTDIPFPVPADRQSELRAGAPPATDQEHAWVIAERRELLDAQKERIAQIKAMLKEAEDDKVLFEQELLAAETALLKRNPTFSDPWLGRFVDKDTFETVTFEKEFLTWARSHRMVTEKGPTQKQLADAGYKLTKGGAWWNPDTKDIVAGMTRHRSTKAVWVLPEIPGYVPEIEP